MANNPVPMIPSANSSSANLPANGLSAAAACAEDWISRMPALCSVAAVVMMIAMAMMLENAIPTSVSIRMRRNSPSCPERSRFSGFLLRSIR